MLRTSLTGHLTVVLAIFIGALLIRESSWLQAAELWVHDSFSRWSAEPGVDSADIAILHVTEPNLSQLGHWPITDAELATVLESLLSAGARAVGLDLYRNLPVPPGERHLESVLHQHHNIIAVHKFGDPAEDGVPGPWALDNRDLSEREGFNDVIPDSDGSVRRALLYQDDGGPVESAFALRLALLVLGQENIGAAPDHRNPDWLRLGAATLPPFGSRDGSYVDVDDAGYQLLLNFSGARTRFPSFDLVSLMQSEVAPELIRGRVIMMGSNAQSLRDYFHIPPARHDEAISGIELHSAILQQLLDYGRGRVEPLSVLTEWEEVAVILCTAILGCAIALACIRMGVPLLGPMAFGPFGVLVSFAAGYLSFQFFGHWIPTLAPSLTWVAALTFYPTWFSSGVLLGGRTRHASRSLSAVSPETEGRPTHPHWRP